NWRKKALTVCRDGIDVMVRVEWTIAVREEPVVEEQYWRPQDQRIRTVRRHGDTPHPAACRPRRCEEFFSVPPPSREGQGLTRKRELRSWNRIALHPDPGTGDIGDPPSIRRDLPERGAVGQL